MKTRITDYAVTMLGLLLLAAGICLLKMNGDPQGIMLTLPYVCIGIGCGLFGHGMGNIISGRIVRSNPEMRKKLEIEEKDERNLSIANCAKGKAFDRMTWVYGALMISFALMGVDMLAVLLLVFAYLLVHGLALYYRFRLDREM